MAPMPRSDQCCGFGGLFSVKMPAISQDMLANKLQDVNGSQADRVVGCDVSCLMHINAGLHRQGQPTKCVHLAQVLAGE
jgi:L-lactate dehydrogenase complex protein LldE